MNFVFGLLVGIIVSFILTAIIEAKTEVPSCIVATLAIPFVTLACFIWNPIKNVIKPCSRDKWEKVIAESKLNYVNLTKSIYYVHDPNAKHLYNKRFFVRVKG